MLGILGGMGPMATVDFMGKIVRNTPASCDQDHIQMVVCSATDVPDRTAAILGQGPDPLPAMLNALRRLELSGATRIAIPCNTAHHWHGALQGETPVPIIHIVDAVADALPRQQTSPTIGLLATDGTVRAGIYQQRLTERGYTCVVPDAKAQAEVMRAIRLVKAGHTDEAAGILGREAEALAARGCSHIAMACTEIPLALAALDSDIGAALLDPTDLLAQACVRSCLTVPQEAVREVA
ncbi:aspartate/glutamate racemase family protein [Bradyrhizobium sp. GCM10027634]|uniref:aspartate/glutamate racemase family protein n=1 Tax=unclassified Bradyrhizobium TaxID=2631580 RepID=UPI00188ABCC3|nr:MULTISPECIES: amino acid racemase [unclassified Bradyrhizobium]MDN4999686.1 amino acid racemase [Bradyrhizobium sp. WYCCWR 12677]QOZ48585.1 aspartate/glutamate racemase family protein [Bradyrhizobium sp. CCBAU 53340]